jgi:hypothetical protein
MHKFITNDQNKNSSQLWSWQLSLARVNLCEIKSWEAIMVQLDEIERIETQLKFVNLKLKP